MRTDLDKLLAKAKDGKLERSELDLVVAGLDKTERVEDSTYTRLHIIGRAYAMDYEELVASFLHKPNDPMLSKIALQILCSWWGLADKYMTCLREFLEGVEWDEEGQVRLIAISAAGQYLREYDDRGLLEKLLEICESGLEDEDDKAAAVDAIARGLGDEWTSFPGLGGRLHKSAWKSDVLSRANSRLSEMESS